MIKTNDGKIVAIPKPIQDGKRFEWLTQRILTRGYTLGAEIGCAGGKTTEYILTFCPDLCLIVVDLWTPVPKEVGGGTQYKKWDFGKVYRRFTRKTKRFENINRLKILKGVSWEMAKKVPDESLDFVFIDADHEYESVKKDILAWTPKLKPNGMMSGHDTHFEGVLQALKELIPNYIDVGVDHCWVAKKEDVLC